MTASLRALLANVIDYAGLFPPASLDLDRSIRNYARYLAGDDAWMLGRFICPAAKLNDLLPYLDELFTETMPLPLSVLANDADVTVPFRDAAGDRATIDVIEAKLPAASTESLPKFVDLAHRANARVFCEAPLTRAYRDDIPPLARSIAMHPQLGLKLRTGGVEASAFPSPEQVAFVIADCRDARCPLKFTAGLHHPIRLFHESVQTKMHGFVNVFAAAVLAHVHGMDEHGVRLILESESPADFTFDEYGLAWKTLRASNQRIEQVRKHFAISFGSCSFDEPREDLRALGLL
jgi:hypothetical protein